MGLHCGPGLRWVARRKGVDNGPVLGDRLQPCAGVGKAQQAAAVHLGLGHVHHLPQHVQPVHLGDGSVQVVIAGDRLVIAGAAHRQLVRLVDVLDILQLAWRNRSRCPLHAFAFKRDADDIGLFDLRPADVGHESAVLRKDLDKSLVADFLDRLAHRRARDAKTPGDLGLVDWCARGQIAHNNRLTDQRIDLLAEGKLSAQLHAIQKAEAIDDHSVFSCHQSSSWRQAAPYPAVPAPM